MPTVLVLTLLLGPVLPFFVAGELAARKRRSSLAVGDSILGLLTFLVMAFAYDRFLLLVLSLLFLVPLGAWALIFATVRSPLCPHCETRLTPDQARRRMCPVCTVERVDRPLAPEGRGEPACGRCRVTPPRPQDLVSTRSGPVCQTCLSFAAAA